MIDSFSTVKCKNEYLFRTDIMFKKAENKTLIIRT